MWHWLRGTGAWHCLTQQRQHLAGQCERLAVVCKGISQWKLKYSLRIIVFVPRRLFSACTVCNSLLVWFHRLPTGTLGSPLLPWVAQCDLWGLRSGLLTANQEGAWGGLCVVKIFLHFKQTSGHRLHLQSLISSFDQTGADKLPLQMSPKSPSTYFSKLQQRWTSHTPLSSKPMVTSHFVHTWAP